jgi:hypothetical protein
VHGANPSALEPALEPEVEIGGVDADEGIRPPCERAPCHVAADREQLGEMPQHLDQAHHRKLLHRMPAFESRRDHARTADAGESRAREAPPQRFDQVRAEEVARGLASDEDEPTGFGNGDS